MTVRIQLAAEKDLQLLLPLVKSYHQFEGIDTTDAHRVKSVYNLLSAPLLGCIAIILVHAQYVGYIALTFGYSIEFGGRDAFTDEFYYNLSSVVKGWASKP
ncbi:MAG: hypothetical protein AAF821_21125 [Cyanobacteria bacterium P01_D01_bin.156]